MEEKEKIQDHISMKKYWHAPIHHPCIMRKDWVSDWVKKDWRTRLKWPWEDLVSGSSDSFAYKHVSVWTRCTTIGDIQDKKCFCEHMGLAVHVLERNSIESFSLQIFMLWGISQICYTKVLYLGIIVFIHFYVLCCLECFRQSKYYIFKHKNTVAAIRFYQSGLYV